MRASVLNEFGEFPQPDPQPWERTVPETRCVPDAPRHVQRPKVDAAQYRGRCRRLLAEATRTELERVYGIAHSTVVGVATGRSRKVQPKTAARLDRALRAHGL